MKGSIMCWSLAAGAYLSPSLSFDAAMQVVAIFVGAGMICMTLERDARKKEASP